MANIDPQSFFTSFLPEVLATKITLEKNNGFFKQVTDPHIESSLEREARLAEPEAFNISIDVESRTKKVAKQKSFFTDQKIINDGIKIGLYMFTEIPEEGFQEKFQELFSGFTTEVGRVFSVNRFETQTERSINNTNFLVKKYNKQTIQYNSEPENLYLVYGAYVELPDEYVNRFGFQGRIFAPVKVETIFEDGKTKSKSSLFFIQNTDDIWAGEVSFNEQEDYYETVEENPRQLEEYSIPNYRLQDSRIQSKIEKQEIEFKKFNEELLNNKLKQKILIAPKNKIYFSDIFLSNRDSSNFFFSLNLRELILDNCMLSKIYQELPLNLRNSIIRRTKILSFKVIRRRIMRSGLSTNPLTDERISFKMMPGEKEEIILACKSNNVNSFLNVVSDKCELKQIKSCFSDTNSYSTFFIKDLDLVNKTEGEYQYGIELELNDPSKQIISDDLYGLRVLQKILINMLSKINKTKNFLTDNQINNFQKEIYWDDPHIADSPKEIIFKTTSNPIVSSGEQGSIEAAVNRYFTVFSKYFTGVSESRQQDLKDIIKSQVSYFVEDTEGLENFINLYDRLITNLEELADNKIFIFDDPHVEGTRGNVRNRSKNFYKVTNYFSNDSADANYLDYKNVDYINKKGKSFNDLTKDEFVDLLGILKSNDRFPEEDKILPFSIYHGSFAKIDPEGVRKLYDSFSFDYRNASNLDIIRHANLSLSFETPQEEEQISNSTYIQLESDIYNIEQDSFYDILRRNQEQNEGSRSLTPEERERRRAVKQNNKSIKEFYDFVYKNIVTNKNIDKLIELYQEGQLDEFYVKFEYLRKFDFASGAEAKSGIWEDAKTLRSTSYTSSIFQFDQDTYLLCRFKPLKNNYKNKNWKISEDMNFTDALFIVKVPSSIEITEIQSSLRPVFTEAIQEEAEVPVIDLEPEGGLLSLPIPTSSEVEFSFEQFQVGDVVISGGSNNGSFGTPGLTQPVSGEVGLPELPGNNPPQPGSPDGNPGNRNNVI